MTRTIADVNPYDDSMWYECDYLELEEYDYPDFDERRPVRLAFPMWSGWLAFAVGVLVVALFVLSGNLVLDYPLTLLPDAGSLEQADATFWYCTICLATTALGAYAAASEGCRPTLWDGLFAPLTALGIYLLPQLAMYLPFLVGSAVACVALTAWDFHDGRRAPSVPRVVWHMATNAALASILLVSLCSVGLIPMAAADSSSGDAAGDVATLACLIDKKSLDDMSYQEVADMASAVVRIEAPRLGLENREPRVLVGYTGTAMASYNSRVNAIMLSAELLHRQGGISGRETVDSLAHEMAHAYQHAVVDGTVPNVRNGPLGTVTASDVKRWSAEFGDADDLHRHFDDYWSQDTEARAYKYATRETTALVAMARNGA